MTLTPDLSAASETPRKSRKNNPEKTRENILQEAIVEFVQQGLSGARVDAHVTLALDVQRAKNPAYNRERGPVSLYGARAHVEF